MLHLAGNIPGESRLRDGGSAPTLHSNERIPTHGFI